MGGDERRPLRARGAQSRLEAFVDADEGAEADSDGMPGFDRVGILVGQLEAGQDEQVVQAARPLALGRDLVEVGVEVGLLDMEAGQGVVGDGEHVETGPAVEVAELAHAPGAVAPRRVGVELAEKRAELGGHLTHSVTTHSALMQGFSFLSPSRNDPVPSFQALGCSKDARMLALAAPDKFRGSLSAAEVAAALAAGAARAGWDCAELPLADGGEGTLDALGGPNRSSRVSGPLGEPVDAAWRLDGGVAVVEAARASGLALVGGAQGNDAVEASTRGTGETIAAALDEGAETVIVGVGGSATTDGGLGAFEVLRPRLPLPARVLVACDVQTAFLDAARVFSPQKGATRAQVGALSLRLADLAVRYDVELGVDVTRLAGAGAAGGLAGGLAALGAELVPGFDLVADRVGLEEKLAEVSLVLTGEGRLDATSFDGKVVGSLLARCAARDLPAIVVAGEVDLAPGRLDSALSLIGRFGRERAWADPAACIADLVAETLARPLEP